MTSTVEGLSRITVVAPNTQLDLALPSDVPLADLLPTLLRHAGEDLADDGIEHHGWVLRRLGGPSLDTGRSAAQLDIRDGELLYLTPRADAAPEVVFDDVVDAVATATAQRPDRWTVTDTRVFATGLTVAALLGALATVLFAGPPQLSGAVVGGGLGLVLLVGATLTSRLAGESRIAVTFALVAIAYGAVGGLLLLADERGVSALAAPDLLLAATALVVYASVATIGVGGYPHVFLGAILTGLALGVAAAICLLFGVAAAVAAGVVGTVAFAAIPSHPMMSYRIAGLPIPAIPGHPDDLKTDIATVDGRRVLRLADRAAEHLGGLAFGTGVVILGCAVVLVLDGGWPGLVLAALLSVLLMLRARPLPGRWHRLPVLVSGAAGLGVVGSALFLLADLGGRLGLVVPAMVIAAVISAGYGLALAGRPLAPVRGRLLDIVEILLIVALVPVAAWVAGLYGWVATVAS